MILKINAKYLLSIIHPCFVIITLLVACSTQNSLDNSSILGKWNIDKAMGKSTEGAETPAYINFESNGKVNGNASVNIFNGEYTLDGEKLTLRNIGMTRMMGASMDVEDAITEAINKVVAVKINADNAYLLGSSSDTLMVLSKEIPMTGAYSEYRTLTDEDKALFQDTYKGEIALTPIKVSTQVVAGMNYSFLCEDKNGKAYVVVIYQPLPGQGVPEVTSVTMK